MVLASEKRAERAPEQAGLGARDRDAQRADHVRGPRPGEPARDARQREGRSTRRPASRTRARRSTAPRSTCRSPGSSRCGWRTCGFAERERGLEDDLRGRDGARRRLPGQHVGRRALLESDRRVGHDPLRRGGACRCAARRASTRSTARSKALGHAYGGGSQYFSTWIVAAQAVPGVRSAEPRYALEDARCGLARIRSGRKRHGGLGSGASRSSDPCAARAGHARRAARSRAASWLRAATRSCTGSRALGLAHGRRRRGRARRTAPSSSSCISPAPGRLLPGADQLSTSRAPRSRTSCRTARRRRSSRRALRGDRASKAADGDRLPGDAPLRGRRRSPASGPTPSSSAGQSDDAAGRAHRRRGHELHVGHDRPPEGRAPPAAAASIPTDRRRCSPASCRCSASSPRTATSTSSARRSTTPRCWCSRRASMHIGHTVVLMDKWTPEDMPAADREVPRHHQPHGADAVPPPARAARGRAREVRLHVDAHDGARRRAVPARREAQMLDWWGDSICEYYAATEGGGTLVSPRSGCKKPGHRRQGLGRAPRSRSSTTRARSCRTGSPAPSTCCAARPTSSTTRTRRRPTRARRGSYFTVGDIGYLDDDGYLFLCDRKIDMIISGGVEHLPGRDRERAAHAPEGRRRRGVRHSARGLGRGGEGGDRAGRTASSAGAGARRARSSTSCSDKLAKYKTPKTIDFIAEMPRDPNGKLYKRKLRDPYWAGRTRNI